MQARGYLDKALAFVEVEDVLVVIGTEEHLLDAPDDDGD